MIFSQKKDIHTGYPYKKEHEASQNVRGTFACDDRSVDIRTVQARQGSNTQETCCPLDDPFILVTYPHFICIANSFSTKKEDTHTGYPQKASTRRDSNPRPSPWQGDTPPLSHSCTHTFKTTY